MRNSAPPTSALLLLGLALHQVADRVVDAAAAKGRSVRPAAKKKIRGRAMKWINFPDDSLALSGLPWFQQNAPRLWRFPVDGADKLPDRVRKLMRYPDGGRIRFASNTSELKLRVTAPHVQSMGNMSPFGCRGFDAYVAGTYWCSATVGSTGVQELTFFQGASRELKQITIYLPTFQDVTVLAIGLAGDANIGPPTPYAIDRPVVFYGSSIAQGASACRPGMTYEAILARRLDLDFVNLGFSGAGRAEPEVVDLIAQIDACCFVFDLGKSYRMQPEQVYGAMLDTIRAAHPSTPMICLTPIFSTREFYDASYTELSRYTRDVMRRAATKRMEAGDKALYLVEGLDLLGQSDADAFHEGVHPTDLGFMQIADRLEPMLRSALFPAE